MNGASDRPETVVVGGGLAGITCALGLADRGHRVTLLERAPVLGGLCRSVADPTVGRVDTGQHVYLGCCSRLEGLLGRLGVRPALAQRRLELAVADPATGTTRVLRAAPLPAPLHLLPVLARWPGLGPGTLVEARRVASSLEAGVPTQLDDVPALGWLQSLGQGQAIIERLWEPFLVAACNVGLDECSAASAAQVVAEGLLGSAASAALRVPGEDLTAWLGEPAMRRLQAAGVTVRVRFRVKGIRRIEGGLEAFDDDGVVVPSTRVVLATTARHARAMLSQGGMEDDGVNRACEIPDSPIVNVHLFTDRPFLPHPIVVVPRSPLQWLFDRSALNPAGRQGDTAFHSAISLSAARDEVAIAEDRLTEVMWELCRSVFPAAARARLLGSRVTREAHATFAPVAGSGASRPGPATSLSGILLAGSWTATGWPATMEGAVRSGEAAARAA